MLIDLTPELQKKLKTILAKVAEDIGLDALAIFTRDGRNLAYWAKQEKVDPDLLSATTAAMLNIGEQTIQKLEKGELWEVIVKGSRGYVIMTRAGRSLLLTGEGVQEGNLNLVIKLLREAGRSIAAILAT
ncbi:MAG: roadblock/LC7 domain-containing protein [Candidatus Odinarchaeota archaeon]|nr:roadblock/LC7 domain-containing protein [Candidatus Odinarchaeota archaeon]